MNSLQKQYKRAVYQLDCITRREVKVRKDRLSYKTIAKADANLRLLRVLTDKVRDRISDISEKIGDDVIECRICGERHNLKGYWGKTRIEFWESGLCHTCRYWTERIASKDEPWSIRVDGRQYIDGGKDNGPKRFKGLCGDAHIFRRIDKKMRQYIVTDNLWVNGDIPERFKSELPDNCERVDFSDWKERRAVIEALM